MPGLSSIPTGNTTKASDGTLKAASPVARIVKSQGRNQRKDVDEDGFTWCGCGTANEEAEGISISRLDTGFMCSPVRSARLQKAGSCFRQWTPEAWGNWALSKQKRQKAVVSRSACSGVNTHDDR